MVSSTAQGGGVAEMLHQVSALLRELGIATRWLVVQPDEPGFFRIDQAASQPDPRRGRSGAQRCGPVRSTTGQRLRWPPSCPPGSATVTSWSYTTPSRSAPEPGSPLAAHLGGVALSIGLDQDLPQTRAAWAFLAEDLRSYDRTVWSAPNTCPRALRDRSSIIHPGLDPLSYKNRDLTFHKLVGILIAAQLMPAYGPVLAPLFDEPARRLQPDGSFAIAVVPEDLALPFRPVVLQVSRWDRLKGWRGLLDGFVKMKRELSTRLLPLGTRERRMLEFVRLILAGPDASSIDRRPRGGRGPGRARQRYRALEPAVQSDVAILTLPMVSASTTR